MKKVTLPLSEYEELKNKADAFQKLQSSDKITVINCWWNSTRVVVNRSDEFLNTLRNDVTKLSTEMLNLQSKGGRWSEAILRLRRIFQ